MGKIKVYYIERKSFQELERDSEDFINSPNVRNVTWCSQPFIINKVSGFSRTPSPPETYYCQVIHAELYQDEE